VRSPGEVLWSERDIRVRERDVSPVTDEVNELGSGEQPREEVDVFHVSRGLVAPVALVVGPGIRAVGGFDGGGIVHALAGGELGRDRLYGEFPHGETLVAP
jgi:hypothetical protein